jgi:hypothetical protein
MMTTVISMSCNNLRSNLRSVNIITNSIATDDEENHFFMQHHAVEHALIYYCRRCDLIWIDELMNQLLTFVVY